MPTKSYISALLRKLHLLNAAEYVRYYIARIRYHKTNTRFRKKHPDVILPPPFFVYETYKLNFEEYYYDGQATAKEIVNEVAQRRDLSRPGTSILDWGCGPGRITRHLPGFLPQADIYATDYNEKYIEWCRREFNGIRFSINQIDPPMNYAGLFFDAIIGLSIFTHLSKKNHTAWINELYRVMKPGGIAFITTQGLAFRPKLLINEQLQFDNGEIVSRENIREGNRLFSTFQPPGLMKELISNKFDVVEFIPAPENQNQPAQDTWLLRKII